MCCIYCIIDCIIIVSLFYICFSYLAIHITNHLNRESYLTSLTKNNYWLDQIAITQWWVVLSILNCQYLCLQWEWNMIHLLMTNQSDGRVSKCLCWPHSHYVAIMPRCRGQVSNEDAVSSPFSCVRRRLVCVVWMDHKTTVWFQTRWQVPHIFIVASNHRRCP